MRKLLLLACSIAAPLTVRAQTGFVNEFHYDNVGTDVNEFVEVALLSTESAGNYQIYGYNGNGGATYGSPITLSTCSTGTTANGYTLYSCPFSGLQNGGNAVTAPQSDGFALVNAATSSVVEFVCYEGTMTAVDGPANGQTCTDVGAMEDNPLPAAGGSIARTGGPSSGWVLTTDDTPGALNASAGQTALPVELVSFTATLDGHRALLRWTTESETNNASFTVEQHSGTAWLPVGTVAGRGTTSELTSYSFSVEGLAAGTYRFRLRQTDFDGATNYSPTVELTVGLDRALDVSVNGRTVRFTAQQAQPVEATLYNALGQRVATLFAGDVEGGSPHTLTVAGDLTAGVYFVRVTGASASQTARVLITR